MHQNKIEKILKAIAPKAKDFDKLVEALATYMPKFGITTDEQGAMFLAQACHESAHFTKFSESLNYSDPKRIAMIFRSGFDLDKDRVVDLEEVELAKQYTRNPRKLANRAYANRNGNGNEASGDGYTYRGRGIFQTTFKNNYVALEKATGIPCVANPDILTQIPEAVISACYFWQSNHLSISAEKRDIKGNTKILNGGDIGLKERTELYKKALASLAEG